MLIVNYVFDLLKWEIVEVSENRKDDVRHGLFTTFEEADLVRNSLCLQKKAS